MPDAVPSVHAAPAPAPARAVPAGPAVPVERMAVALEPRDTTHCLDMAAMFYGRHVPAMLRLWAVVAVPAGAAVYLLASWFGFDLRLALVAVYAATAVQGTLLVLATVPALFGARLTIGGGLAGAGGGRVVGLLLQKLAVRAVAAIGPGLMLFSEAWGPALLGFVLLLFPCGWLAVRFGFLAETAALRGPKRGTGTLPVVATRTSNHQTREPVPLFGQALMRGLDERLHDERTRRLLREQTSDLYSRACWIAASFVMLWAVVFITLDFGWYLIAGNSPLVSRVLETVEGLRTSGAEAREVMADAWWLLTHDAWLQVELLAAGLLVYPVARLAWLFCYLDVRIRQDCWDIQLRFAEETRRIRRSGTEA